MEDVVVTFSEGGQSLGALQEAAYRLIGRASCLIESSGGFHSCRLTSTSGGFENEGELRGRFLDLVTDENLREKLRAETSGTRDLILALAFGALAEASGDAPGE